MSDPRHALGLAAKAAVAAIAFGTAAVTFAVGLGSSLNRVQEVEDIADVAVRGAPPAGARGVGPMSPDDMRFTDPAAVARTIAAQAGTGTWARWRPHGGGHGGSLEPGHGTATRYNHPGSLLGRPRPDGRARR